MDDNRTATGVFLLVVAVALIILMVVPAGEPNGWSHPRFYCAETAPECEGD